MQNTKTYTELIKNALTARKLAYAPYSHYKVGAAVLCDDGSIYTGCNIENASYGATNCVERTAIFKAVSEGHTNLDAIAIVGGDETETGVMSDYAYPCGMCRQVMREFASSLYMPIIVAKSIDEYEVYTLEELLPKSFGPDKLNPV